MITETASPRSRPARWEWVEEGSLDVHKYWLGYGGMAAGLLEDYDLEPAEHPEIVSELGQSIGEAIIDTLLDVLKDHADDPRIASVLREARGGGVVRARVQSVALAAACWTILLPLAAYRGLL